MAIDKLNVFDHRNGPNPFLLLYRHGSQFELDFLSYIHAEDMKWDVCIGLPYGTSYWQVSDSMEQNGCFKMALTKDKQQVVQYKHDNGLDFMIENERYGGSSRKGMEIKFCTYRIN
jgi:hypothetical protein